jgi:tetratricopeptide (TPR) repeat protein
MKMDRAQQLADRVRRIREEMNEARARLAAGEAKEAIRILAGVLADDPAHAEAPGLLLAAQQEQLRQNDAARADAILYARHLVTQGQFAQAIEALTACARKVGDHADLQRVAEEVCRAEAAAATKERIESALASASGQVGKGEFAAASTILAPLAAEFPAHVDIRELLKFVAQEEARVRRVMEQLASLEKPTRSETPTALPLQEAKPERTRVIDRALEMSQEHEQCGQIAEAMHVLDVALSRYPEAAVLVNERLRLLAPKPAVPSWAPGQAPKASTQMPAPAPPQDHKADVGRISVPDSPAPAPSIRRFLWAGGVAAGVLLFVGLGYRLFTKPTPTGLSNSPRCNSRPPRNFRQRRSRWRLHLLLRLQRLPRPRPTQPRPRRRLRFRSINPRRHWRRCFRPA